ncbi:MAG: amino acid ABC transporter substrate-binding protein [Alphaproteobacteria bacterium]|nr:amino acid ABC transporter substrate-binding protein [Alphaproteobacteria bacterium]
MTLHTATRAFVSTLAVGIALTLGPTSARAGETFDQVKQRGMLHCGVSEGLPGFSNPDDKGNWKGLDVEFCRAVAAAIIGDASKVRFTPLSARQRFEVLRARDIDILSRNTTWTQSRDTALGFDFVGITFYDGQGFMVRREIKVMGVKQLDGATVCLNIGSSTELNLADYFRANRLKYTPVQFERSDEAFAAYVAGRCDAYTTDISGLVAQRSKLGDADAHVILPDVISKEPLGPVVRHGDAEWTDLARWTFYAMLNAEELGITAGNVDELKAKSQNPEVRRLLGVEGQFGKNLGLSEDWAFNIVKQVGNYGEVFDRNLGPASPLKLERGLNRLWTEGGLQYAPPVR